MVFILNITSKNKKSIFIFIKFFQKLIKTKIINIFLYKSQIKKWNKKIITVLKSPHVHKKAKEKFTSITYFLFFIFCSLKVKKILYFLKFLEMKILSDIKILINFFIQKNKYFFYYTNLKYLDIIGENLFV